MLVCLEAGALREARGPIQLSHGWDPRSSGPRSLTEWTLSSGLTRGELPLSSPHDLSGGGLPEFSHHRGVLVELMEDSWRDLSVLALFIYFYEVCC